MKNNGQGYADSLLGTVEHRHRHQYRQTLTRTCLQQEIQEAAATTAEVLILLVLTKTHSSHPNLLR